MTKKFVRDEWDKSVSVGGRSIGCHRANGFVEASSSLMDLFQSFEDRINDLEEYPPSEWKEDVNEKLSQHNSVLKYHISDIADLKDRIIVLEKDLKKTAIEDVNKAMEDFSIKNPAKSKRDFEIVFADDEVALVKCKYYNYCIIEYKKLHLQSKYISEYEPWKWTEKNFPSIIIGGMPVPYKEFEQSLEEFKKQHSLHMKLTK